MAVPSEQVNQPEFQRLRELFKELTKECNDGYIYLHLCRQTQDALVAGSLPKETIGFFESAWMAFQDAAFIRVARLMDDHSDAQGIPYVLRFVEANQKALTKALGADVLKELLQRLDADRHALSADESLRKSVKAIRDKVVSHLQKGTTTMDVTNTFPVSYDELSKLFESIWKVLIGYASLLGNTPADQAMSLPPDRDLAGIQKYLGK